MLFINFGDNKLAVITLNVVNKSNNFLISIFQTLIANFAPVSISLFAIPNIKKKLFKNFIKAYLRLQVQFLALALVFSKL